MLRDTHRSSLSSCLLLLSDIDHMMRKEIYLRREYRRLKCTTDKLSQLKEEGAALRVEQQKTNNIMVIQSCRLEQIAHEWNQALDEIR